MGWNRKIYIVCSDVLQHEEYNIQGERNDDTRNFLVGKKVITS